MLIRKENYSLLFEKTLKKIKVKSLEPEEMDLYHERINGKVKKGGYALYTEGSLEFLVSDDLKKKTYRIDKLVRKDREIKSKKECGDFKTELKVGFGRERIRIEFSSFGLKGKNRGIGYTVRLPLPDNLYPWNRDWKIWTATKGYPLEIFDCPVRHVIPYGGPDCATTIPSLTVYNPLIDVGLTLLKPLNVKSPGLFFVLNREERYIEVNFSYLGLRKGGTIHMPLEIIFHQGDWRCGLKSIYEDYPEYFEPNNPNIQKEFIVMTQTGWGLKEKQTYQYLEKSLKTNNKDIGCNFSEVMHYWPRYGEYLPDADRWKNTRYAEGRPDEGHIVSRADIHQHINDLKKLKIGTLLYHHPVGACNVVLAKRRFADSIARCKEAEPDPMFKNVKCNTDRNLSFGKHMQEQTKRLISEFGEEIKGFFWDQGCWGFYDYGHDDGLTMIDNKPAYKFTFLYDRPKEEIFDWAKKNNKYIFNNAPWDVEVSRGFDCVMAESLPWLIEHLSYMCLSKPLNAFYYTRVPEECEEIFQVCLKYGAVPSARIDINTEEIRKLYIKYKPFFKLLVGRRWVLEKKAVEFSGGWDGNIFEIPGGYIVFLIKSMAGVTTREKVECRVNPDKVREGDKIRVMGISGKELEYTIELKEKGLKFEITHPEDVNAIIIE